MAVGDVRSGQDRQGPSRGQTEARVVEGRGRAVTRRARKYRTLTQEFFEQLCTETGGVSNPALLLDYLHHVGIVFYQKGLFDDRIVLDQEWALQAVYAVFQRRSAIARYAMPTVVLHDRCSMALVWSEYSVDEQKLFLSMMQSCGVCFVHRQEESDTRDGDRVHRPRFAAGRDEVAMEAIDAMEGRSTAAGNWLSSFPSFTPVYCGDYQPDREREAGITALYWKYGVCLYEGTTHSRARIEHAQWRLPPPGAARPGQHARRQRWSTGTTQRVDRP